MPTYTFRARFNRGKFAKGDVMLHVNAADVRQACQRFLDTFPPPIVRPSAAIFEDDYLHHQYLECSPSTRRAERYDRPHDHDWGTCRDLSGSWCGWCGSHENPNLFKAPPEWSRLDEWQPLWRTRSHGDLIRGRVDGDVVRIFAAYHGPTLGGLEEPEWGDIDPGQHIRDGETTWIELAPMPRVPPPEPKPAIDIDVVRAEWLEIRELLLLNMWPNAKHIARLDAALQVTTETT